MRYLLLILAVLLFAMPVSSGTARKGGSGGGNAIPGLSNGIGDDRTKEWMYSLTYARGLPNLPTIHLSNNAGGFYGLGTDSDGCGGQANPCRSLDYCFRPVRAGARVRCRLDAGDTWDWADILDVGGISVTASMTIDDAAETITLGSGTWTALGFPTSAPEDGRIELSGSAADDGTLVVDSISSGVITTKTDLTNGETASLTVQAYHDNVIVPGCGADVRTQPCVAFIIEGSDPTGAFRPVIDCSSMTGTEYINFSNNAMFEQNHTNESTRIVAQNLIFENCPANENTLGDKSQDLFRLDGSGTVILVNVDSYDMTGINNQLFTSHGVDGHSLLVNVGGSVADHTDGYYNQVWQPAAEDGINVLVIGSKEMVSNNTTSTTRINILANSGEGDTHDQIWGGVVRSVSGGSYQVTGMTKLVDVGDTNGGDTATLEIIETSFQDLNTTDCDSVSDCSSAINLSLYKAGDSSEDSLNIDMFRVTASNVGSFMSGTSSGANDDFTTIDGECLLIDEVLADSGGDAMVIQLSNNMALGGSTLDFNVSGIIDEGDGTNVFDFRYAGGATEYATAATAESGEGFTNLFTDGNSDESDGNQFCTDGSQACAAPEVNLESQAMCAWTQCQADCATSKLVRFPVSLLPDFEILAGEPFRGIFVNKDASTDPLNTGAK